MDIESFQDPPTGQLVPITLEEGGASIDHFAFVPDPLPDELTLSSARGAQPSMPATTWGDSTPWPRNFSPTPS